MKKILTLVLVSVLGGIITLSTYKVFIEEDAPMAFQTIEEQPSFIPTTYNGATANFNTSEAPDFTVAAEKTIHAVVHVKNTRIVQGQPSFEDFFYGRNLRRSQIGTGSGVIIDPKGYIITNNHVIAGSTELSVTLNNNKTYDAELIGTDEKTDIALLKIDADEALPAINFGDSDQARIGEWVLAVGNPFNLNSTVTAGIISAKSRDLSGINQQSFIQTDAAVNPGNSGGALVNANGDLIGINTAISSQTGSYIGYSFAVPSNIARKVVEDIMEFGNVQTGILGVSILNRNAPEAIEKGVNEIQGVYVSDVEDRSGAQKAGLRSGDIIKRLDNIRISKFSDLNGYLKTKRPNDIVEVEIERNKKKMIIPVTLSATDIMAVEFLDMELRNLPDSIKEEYNIQNGVIIQKSDNQWLYKKLGFRPGYVITAINDVKLNSIEDVSKLKQTFGDDILKNIEKLEFIDRNLERQSVIFR